MDYYETVDFTKEKVYCPWIPGCSFLTDGIQFQLPLLTVNPRETRGLGGLFKKGYTGFKKQKDDEPSINMNNIKKGIYCLGKDNIQLDAKDLKKYNFLGIDPGRKKPMSACIIEGEQIPVDWNTKEREVVINNAMDTNEFITNKDYYDICGMTADAEFEEMHRRKNTEYMEF